MIKEPVLALRLRNEDQADQLGATELYDAAMLLHRQFKIDRAMLEQDRLTAPNFAARIEIANTIRDLEVIPQAVLPVRIIPLPISSFH